MYWNDHNPPHFHAKYGEYDAIISIEYGTVTGNFPQRATNLVLEWLSLHKSELLHNWSRAANGEQIHPIAPLE